MTLEEKLSDLLEGYVPDAEYRRLRRISKRQAQRERAARVGPPWVKLGREIYYSVPGFREWLAAQEVKPVRTHCARGRRLAERARPSVAA